jgi:hypothetical protein
MPPKNTLNDGDNALGTVIPATKTSPPEAPYLPGLEPTDLVEPKKTDIEVIAWDAVLDALDDHDLDTLLRFADQLCKESKPMVQEGVSIEEQITQIKRLAPGKHPHTSSLVRGLCESLKQAQGEGLR